MKTKTRKFSRLLAFFLIFAQVLTLAIIFPVTVSAVHTDEASFDHTTGTFTLDGEKTETEWGSATAIHLPKAKYNTTAGKKATASSDPDYDMYVEYGLSETDLSGRADTEDTADASPVQYQALWKYGGAEQYLYIVLDVKTTDGEIDKDDYFYVVVDEEKKQSWPDPVYMPSGAGEACNNSQIRISGKISPYNDTGSMKTVGNYLKYFIKDTDDGYTVEMQYTFHSYRAIEGGFWMNIAVSDNDATMTEATEAGSKERNTYHSSNTAADTNSSNQVFYSWSYNETALGGNNVKVWQSQYGVVTLNMPTDTSKIKPTDGQTVAGIVHYAYTTTDAMTLDGQANEDAWAKAVWSSKFKQTMADKHGFDGKETDIQYKALTQTDNDRTHLYILLDVADATANGASDGFEFYISELKDTSGVVEVIDATTSTATGNLRTTRVGRDEAGEIKTRGDCFSCYLLEKTDGSGYTVEMKYTFEATQTSVWMNIMVFDNTTDRFLTNSTGKYSWSTMNTHTDQGSAQNSPQKMWPNNYGMLYLVNKDVSQAPAVVENPTTKAGIYQNVYKISSDTTVNVKDGVIDDIWAKANWSTDFMKEGANATTADIQYKALWQEGATGQKHLYILLDVVDEVQGDTGDAFILQVSEAKQESICFTESTKALYYYGNTVYAWQCFGNKRLTEVSRAAGENAKDVDNKLYSYKLTEKTDGSGYYVEMKYTFTHSDVEDFWFNVRVKDNGTFYSWSGINAIVQDAAGNYNTNFKAANAGLVKLIDTDVNYAVIETLYGAGVRIDKSNYNETTGEVNASSSGLRWEHIINKAVLADLLEEAGLTEANIVTGTLILPTDYLNGEKKSLDINALLTNPELVAGTDYLNVVNTGWYIDGVDYTSEDECHTFFGAIAAIKEENFDRDFSAVGYVKIGDTYYYGVYVEDYHARSVREVAEKAVNDYTDPASVAILNYYLPQSESNAE